MQGQLSDLPRKSIEPMALAAGVAPRTLQSFFSHLFWDGPHLRDRVQWIVARDHAHPQAIGIVDESGNPKKGRHTAGVQRQWCGNTGKTGQLRGRGSPGLCGGRLPVSAGQRSVSSRRTWAEDPVRRREVGIPEEVVFRTKPEIALAQIASRVGQWDSGGGLDVR